jgi:hypothetical protein
MTTTPAPALDPFTPPVLEEEPPRPARLEIVERHDGEKYGPDRPIMPNGIRINGVPVWCPGADPIIVKEVRVDGTKPAPLVTVLRLQARALRIGEEPSRADLSSPDVRTHFATVELPVKYESSGGQPRVWGFGEYAIVDGQKVELAGPIEVDPVQPDVGSDERVVVVTLPLVCRSVVFDDEPAASKAL